MRIDASNKKQYLTPTVTVVAISNDTILAGSQGLSAPPATVNDDWDFEVEDNVTTNADNEVF